MLNQHHTILSTLPSNILSSVIAGLFFALSVWAPLRLWQPFACAFRDDGPCEFDATVSLLGVAIAVFAHSIAVAIFAWTPLSSPLRSAFKSSQRPSMFNTFLHASLVCDIIAYGHALTYMKGIVGFIQAATITFNVPFVVLAPYLIAAYADPSTDLGSFVHRIKARIVEYSSDDSECYCGESNCTHKAMDRANLIFPQTWGSRRRYHREVYDDEDDYSEEEMSAHPEVPRFSLFVTAPQDSAPEQYMPLPVSQQV